MAMTTVVRYKVKKTKKDVCDVFVILSDGTKKHLEILKENLGKFKERAKELLKQALVTWKEFYEKIESFLAPIQLGLTVLGLICSCP